MNRPILVKCYLKSNLGDDLFLATLVKRYPEQKFEVFVDPQYATKYSGIHNVRVIKKGILFRVLNRLCKLITSGGIYSLIKTRYSAVVEIGGSIFPERERNPKVDPEREYLANHLSHYFVIGSNFGPYKTDEFLKEYRNFFKKIEGAVFRDKKTYDLFSDLSNVKYAPDVVFTLPLSENKVDSSSDKDKYVVISLIDLSINDVSRQSGLRSMAQQYENYVTKVALELLSQNYTIKFLPFSTAQNDLLVSKRIRERILGVDSKANVSIIDSSNDQYKLETIKNSTLLISTRYHSMILGWLFNVPQLVLVYGDKTKQVINDLYTDQYKLTLDVLNEKTSFDASRMNTVPNIMKIKEQAELQFFYLDSFLGVNQ
ncbi:MULTISPECIES: polysaccharide pyruvyl transferase family protein [Lactiplantibacillus]|uniref:polysaccharide pyruvyl transferase family protein n=1 Tax=Lactiplantibacillus TaxID=2767842 RepID=UPI001CCD585E|nr:MULTISPECIES: polysaccharide pyruvyl transferase family protein [Lactiplantibacillus]MCA5599148.1 polysaccharide pyruvyl transferase family protein [Lactiplantibacillus argentoratensis]MDN7020676.1 polysaccharide pyruvyl transferase family protein [Lactiplantibacillus plantarum]